MRILAIDTTGLVASVAIVEDDKTIAEFTTNYKKNHSVTIMPMTEQVLVSAGINISDVDYIACSSGPGSFTGLRIGAATAKGLAFGADKLIIPVPTLDAMAYNIFKCGDIIAPIMDAKRNQAYTAFYLWEDNDMKRLSEYDALDINGIIDKLKKFNKNTIFLGDGVSVFKDIITNSGIGHSFAPPNLNLQRASSVASLAIKLAERGEILSPKDFAPFYLRKSQAERELEERNLNKEIK